MERQRSNLKAGLFILVSIALVFVIVGAINGIARYLNPSQIRTARFSLKDDLGGLRVGDDVRIGGYKVGEVRRIEILLPGDPRAATRPSDVPTREPMVLVTFSLPLMYELREGAQVSIQTGLTGQSNLNFDTLGTGHVLPDRLALIGQPGAMSVVMSAMRDMAPSIKSTADDVSAMASSIRTQTLPRIDQMVANVQTETIPAVNSIVADVRAKHIGNIMDRFNAVSDAAREMLRTITDMIGPTTTDFHETMAHVRSITGQVDHKMPRMLDQADTILFRVDTALAGANAAMTDLRQTMRSAREIGAEVESAVAENRPNIDAMLMALAASSENVKHTSSTMKYAMAELRRSPWRLIFKPDDKNIANIDLFDAARQFAEGAAQLNETAQALDSAMREKNADPARLKKLRQELDERFTRFRNMEDKLWELVKAK